MKIIPFTSIGLLKFGDSRQDARGKFASRFSTFAKFSEENPIDLVADDAIHLHYSDAGLLEFVEAFDPAEVTFQDIAFLGRDLEAVISDMMSIGFSPTRSDVGVEFEGAGIALYAPSGVVEAVAAHREGYDDE